jgi:hypothetical protein
MGNGQWRFESSRARLKVIELQLTIAQFRTSRVFFLRI